MVTAATRLGRSASNHARALSRPVNQFLEDRVDARLHGTAAQKLRAEGVDSADEGAVQAARGFGETVLDGGVGFQSAAAFQFVADAQFHVAGGSVREGDGHDGFHGRAGGDDFDHAVHQRRGLAGAGGGFHHPTAVEIGDGDGGHAVASGRWWGGPPGPRGSPWIRFSPPESASSMESTPTGASAADQGVRPTILGKLYVIASLAILSSLSARLAIFP